MSSVLANALMTTQPHERMLFDICVATCMWHFTQHVSRCRAINALIANQLSSCAQCNTCKPDRVFTDLHASASPCTNGIWAASSHHSLKELSGRAML